MPQLLSDVKQEKTVTDDRSQQRKKLEIEVPGKVQMPKTQYPMSPGAGDEPTVEMWTVPAKLVIPVGPILV